MDNQEVLLDALLSKIATIIYGEEDKVSDENSYLSWLKPGIPFQAEDLMFASKGIFGDGGEDAKRYIKAASEFSAQVNAIPASCEPIFDHSSRNLVDLYSSILRMSRVKKDEITQAEKAKIEKLRGLLTTTIEKVDIITDEKVQITTDSPMVVAYNETKMAYDNAKLAYNNLRVSAMTGDSKEAVMDFAMNGPIYESRVNKALQDWTTMGYKEYFDGIAAYIQQTSQRSMSLIKADLLSRFTASELTDPETNSKFQISLFYPSSFINSNDGWTDFSFTTHSDHRSTSDSKGKGSGSVSKSLISLWGGKADATHERESKHVSFNEEDFSISFKITQVTISRPWFSLDFVTNNMWAWSGEELCDGGDPPKGAMTSFPTTIIFVKDVAIKSSNVASVYDEIKKSTTAGGSVRFGPFKFGATGSHSSSNLDTSLDSDKGEMKISGMQMIAFKCFKMPKTPNCNLNPSDLQ